MTTIIDDGKSGVARPYATAPRRSPRRVPIGDARGTPAHPQLVIGTLSLMLWTLIIAACTLAL